MTRPTSVTRPTWRSQLALGLMTLSLLAALLITTAAAEAQSGSPALPAGIGATAIVEAESSSTLVDGGTPQTVMCAGSCSADAKVGFFFPGGFFDLDVEPATAGEFTISAMAYSSSATDPATISVALIDPDGTPSALGDLIVTGSPTTFTATETLTIALDQGTHTLRFANVSAGNVAADIDSFQITRIGPAEEPDLPVGPTEPELPIEPNEPELPVGPTAPSFAATVEAESSATLTPGGSPQAYDCPVEACSGGQKVAFFFPGGFFDIDVDVPAAGDFEIIVHSSVAAEAAGQLTLELVTSGAATPLGTVTAEPTGDPNTFAPSSSLTAPLAAGSNLVRISNTSVANIPIDIDLIAVSSGDPAPTEPTVPTGPTVPTEPTEPIVPTEPTEPTEPVVPTEPTAPIVPTEPTDPTEPTEPTEPTAPIVPTEPTDPTEPTEPTDPPVPPVQGPEGRFEAELSPTLSPGGTQAIDCGPGICSNDQKVGFFFPNSSFDLDVTVAEAGVYVVSARSSNDSADTAGDLRISRIDAGVTTIAAELTVPPTGSTDAFIDTATQALVLPAGTTRFQLLNATTANVALDVDYLTVVPRADIDPSTLSQEELDALAGEAAAETARLMTNYQDAVGAVVPEGAGRRGLGVGFFHRANTGAYGTSIAAALVDAGVADALLVPKNPQHADISVRSSNDMLLRVCGDRVGVFTSAPTLETSPADIAWWTDNECRTDSSRDFFVLTADRTAFFDAIRVQEAHNLSTALTAYQDLNGLARVQDAGWNGRGVGFANRIDGEKYAKAITATLVEQGLLDPNDMPRNPRQLDAAGSSRHDFLVRSCNGRLSVFVDATTLSPSAADSAWWADNECPAELTRNYFVLTSDRTELFDAIRSQGVNTIVSALDEYQSETGVSRVADAGRNGRGTGFFHRAGTDSYQTSIASVLTDRGLIEASAVPRNPLHLDLSRSSSQDFFIRVCNGRAGVFVEAPTLVASASDAEWWADNECRVDEKRNYFVLTGNAPVFIHNPPVNDGPIINPLKGWNTGWFTGIDDNNLDEEFLAEISSVGYQTIPWAAWEPEDDEFAVEAVRAEYFDRDGSVGRHLVLQLHVDWTNGDYRGPDWLLDLVPERPGATPGNRASDYENEDFRREANEAVAEFLKEFGDDQRVHIVQLGMLGYYGEWHTDQNQDWYPSDTVLNEIRETYFTNLGGNFTQARYPNNALTPPRAGMGYVNGWAYPDEIGIDDFNVPIEAGSLWENGPVGGEWPPNRLPRQNEGGTVADWTNFFSTTGDGSTMTGLEYIQQGHYSHLQPPNPRDVREMLPNWSPQDPYFLEMHRAFGYNFQLSNIRQTVADDALSVQFDVSNVGIAPFYEDWDVEIAVLAENDMVVATVMADADIRTWAPDSRQTVSVSLPTADLDPTSTYRIGLRISIPDADEPGAQGWGLNARNAYIVMSNDLEVIEGSFIDTQLTGGWNVLDSVREWSGTGADTMDDAAADE